jgi:hypothetical protein
MSPWRAEHRTAPKPVRIRAVGRPTCSSGEELR